MDNLSRVTHKMKDVDIDIQMDSNKDGFVDFMEFVAATLHVHQLEDQDSEK
ncbi:putative non-specific serine/threonine protein kinase [Helianthus debilis subsp. tardiflorus]